MEMKFSFDGTRLLNGREMHLQEYRFFDGPFIQSALRSGVITLRYKNKSRTLDFNKVEIQEEH